MATKIQAQSVSYNFRYQVSTGTKVQDQAQGSDNQSVKKTYTFLKRCRNEAFEDGLTVLPLRSCLIHHKSAVFRSSQLYVKTAPKWYTDLFCEGYDVQTGELVHQEVYRTDDFKQSNGRKIKCLDRFCNHFQPLYARKQVSILFYTLTIANQAKMDIKGIVDVFKKRFKRRDVKVYGYIWTAEVSEGLHFHYHIAVAVDRLNLRGSKLPAWMILENAWGARTQVEFVKRNIRHYMAKYFAKHQYRIVGIRSYGSSISKQNPEPKM